MKVTTYEGRVENGQVRLSDPVRLPEKAKVYVIVPETAELNQVRILSPRLANPVQAAEFAMEVTEEPRDAGLRQ